MKLIIITAPQFFDGEANAITALFDVGLEILHLRKPDASIEEIEQLLINIPAKYRGKIVTHEHFKLVEPFGLKGIHLNGRNKEIPENYTGHISCSCHTLEEVEQRKAMCDYLFLSPIYNSISKEGYSSAFSYDVLKGAFEAGIIDSKVMALGGVCLENFGEISSLGFGGVVLLGDIWQRVGVGFIEHYLLLQTSLQNMVQHPIVLSIAGSDCSGGAGIQADIKTISALGGYAATAITAVTVQNTLGVKAIHSIPVDIVKGQIEAVMDDLPPYAIKIGMVHNPEIVRTIVECIKKYSPRYIVCDPVMISTSGSRLITEETIEVIKNELFPLCTIVTPNLSEAASLCGRHISTIKEMEQVAKSLSVRYNTSFLIKGGHLVGQEMCDVLYVQNLTHYTAPKIESKNVHGTGCTLSSAIATYLAYGNSIEGAVKKAKDYINRAIVNGKELNVGGGSGPLWHF